MMTSDDDINNNSPFDVALAKPFLDEPVRKKWTISLPLSPSWMRRSSSSGLNLSCYGGGTSTRSSVTSATTATTIACEETIHFDDSHNEEDEEYDDEERPLLLLQSPTQSPTSVISPTLFGYMQHEDGSNKNKNNEKSIQHQHFDLAPPILSTSTPSCDGINDDDPFAGCDEYDDENEMMMELVPLTSSIVGQRRDVDNVESGGISTLDGDTAIMTERNAELGGIASSMRQIAAIQKDFATVVDEQGADIQRLSWKSIEAFGHAQSGLEHLVKTVKTKKDRKAKFYSLMVSGLVVLAFCYIIAGIFASPNGGGGGTAAADIIPSSSMDERIKEGGEYTPKLLLPVTMLLNP